MGMVVISACPICNGSDFKEHLICTDYTSSHENFTIKKCGSCQFLMTDPRPEDASLSKYYLSNKYISHTGKGENLIDKVYLLARKFTLAKKRKLINKHSTKRSALDIGCGTGEFLSELKSHGWQIAGVEPSDNARALAEKITETKIYQSLLEIHEGAYDVVTLWHVLEHLPNLSQALTTISKLINPTGTIFIAVPNPNSFDAKHYKSFWAGYDVPRHLWHFSQDNMKMLLEKNGLKIVSVVPMKLDSFYVSMLSESYENQGKHKLIQLLSAFLVGLRSNIRGKTTSEYSSLIYVARP
jgi:2-polyprenyl-3-methyl-5-hydroxy-6-metoxy-1,4-benzoquinol methylase